MSVRLQVLIDAGQPPTLKRAAAARAASPEMGEIARLGSDELCARFPALRADLDGIWIEGAARVDGRLLCAGLLAAVRCGSAAKCAAGRSTSAIAPTVSSWTA